MTRFPSKTVRGWAAATLALAALGAMSTSTATAATPLATAPETPTTTPTTTTTAATTTTTAAAAADGLPQPLQRQVDGTLAAERVAAMSLAARRYYGFWNSGDDALARAALAPDFVDRALPPGRPQGVAGPLQASRQFRAAVPDLRVTVEEMLIVGDRVVGRLRFSGHFSGTFGAGAGARRGDGRAIDFIATDIYRIDAAGRIAENWHLEDNLTLLTQLGVVTP